MTLNSILDKLPYIQINLKLLSVKFQKAKKDEFRRSSFSTLLLKLQYPLYLLLNQVLLQNLLKLNISALFHYYH